MDKRTITGFVLIALILFGFAWWQQPSAEQIAQQRAEFVKDSIAAAKKAQNARLAAKLTNWRIDIKGLEKYREDVENGLIEVGFDGEQEFIDNGYEL